MDEQPKDADLGWHIIHGSFLLEILHRVSGGEDPDFVYAELWANAEHQPPEPP